MDNIGLQIGNIFTISACDLNTKFNDKSHTDWSKSNLISLVTLDGIYILEPQLEKSHGPHKIELIKNPSQKFRHDVLEGIIPIFDNQLQLMESKQYLNVFLDPALTTNTEKLSLDTCPRRFRLAKWSPVIDTYPRQCLLTAITVDYQLLVFNRRCGLWLLNADLSRDYDRVWIQMNKNLHDNNDSNSYETIRHSLHSMSFCNLCWKELADDGGGGGPLLLAATITGDIVVWRTSTNRQCDHRSQCSFEIKTVLRTQQEYITSMQVYDNLLIASSRNGEVILYDLTKYLEEFVVTNNVHETNEARREQQQQEADQAAPAPPTSATTKSLPLIQLFPTAILWHRDGIEVADFYLQRLNSDTLRIILAKSTNICWCTIHYSKATEGQPAKLAIADSFSAIDGLDPDVSLHQTPASWLRQADERRAVLIADDGSFFQLDFVDDHTQDASPAFSAIRTDKVDLTDMIPRGLCTSPNGHLITMISSVTFMYDPVRVPNPSKLITLPTWNDKKFLEDCLKKLADEQWLTSNEIRSPMDVCDRLDYVRSTFAHLSPAELGAVYQTLSEVGDKAGRPSNQFQLARLKVIAFLQMKMREYCNFKIIDGDHQKSVLPMAASSSTSSSEEGADCYTHNSNQHVHDVILLCYIEQILQNALIPSTERNDESLDAASSVSLTPDQMTSVGNYLKWLHECCSSSCSDKQKIYEKYSEKFAQLVAGISSTTGDVGADLGAGQEVCSICQGLIPFQSAKFAVCENQHRFMRCSRSLLVLSLDKYDELECEHCKRHYISKLILEPRRTDDLWLCLYCQ